LEEGEDGDPNEFKANIESIVTYPTNNPETIDRANDIIAEGPIPLKLRKRD
jgi:hypothetical protein